MGECEMIGHGFLRIGTLGMAFFMALFLADPVPVCAHRVNVFAWVEGDTVHTESKFSGGRTVNGGEVFVYDLEGSELLAGKTNEQGEFSFKVPKKAALKIVLQAGMGHRAEWIIPLEEISPAASQPASKTGSGADSASARGNRVQEQAMSSRPLGAEEIERAVERALDKKLQPFLKRMAESKEQRPSFREILGGIGYILGLVGIATYFHARRKKPDSMRP